MHEIRCCGPRRADRAPSGARVINVTSMSRDPGQVFSPFKLRPAHGLAHNVENYWQYSKVFPRASDGRDTGHWNATDLAPTREWYLWRDAGWRVSRGVRHPMGKGARPVCSWVEGIGPLGYTLARELLYIPSYLDAVRADPHAQNTLQWLREQAEKEPIWLWDFDTYDHVQEGMSLADLIADEMRPLGHGFLVWALATGAAIPTPLRTWGGQRE